MNSKCPVNYRLMMNFNTLLPMLFGSIYLVHLKICKIDITWKKLTLYYIFHLSMCFTINFYSPNWRIQLRLCLCILCLRDLMWFIFIAFSFHSALVGMKMYVLKWKCMFWKTWWKGNHFSPQPIFLISSSWPVLSYYLHFRMPDTYL